MAQHAVIDQAREQRDKALVRANENRMILCEYRRALRSGTLTLESVLLDPPEIFANELLIDLVRMARARRQRGWVERLGRRAIAERVNLCIPLSRASARTRVWVAHEAGWHRDRKPRVA